MQHEPGHLRPALARRLGGHWVLACLCALALPAVAGAAPQLYFDVTASVSDVPIGGGETVTGSIHYLRVLPVQAGLAAGEPLCRAYVEGRVLSAGGRPAVVTPLALGDIGSHSLEAFGIYVRPLPHGARTKSYRFTAARPDGQFPFDQTDNLTNDPFWIDHDNRYLGATRIAVTLRRDGSGEVVEQSPHAYSDRWTCSERPPISFTVLDAKGNPWGGEAFNLNSWQMNETLTLAGAGFDPRGGPIELRLDGRRIARLAPTEQFRVRYELRDFPSHRCTGTFRALQDRARPAVQFAVRVLYRVAVVQGPVRTHLRTLRQGDELCVGDEEVAELGSSGVPEGAAAVLASLPFENHPAEHFVMVSRPRHAAPIVASVTVKAGRNLTVALPRGSFRADGPGGDAPYSPPPMGCTVLPPTVRQRIGIGRCVNGPRSVHLDGGIELGPVNLNCGDLPDSVPALEVDGTIVIHHGIGIEARLCHGRAEVGGGATSILRAHGGALEIDGGIDDRTELGADTLQLYALGPIIIRG